jgi:hypothetical protein
MTYICDVPKKFCNLRDEKDKSCRLNKPCLPVVEQCAGCLKEENGYCKVYVAPIIKWAGTRTCPMATHIVLEVEDKNKTRVGQQKQKRKSR